MIKHYKALVISLAVVAILAVSAWLMRSHFKILPALHIDYEQLVNQYATEYELEPELVFAVIKTESNFNPNATSQKNAHGLMQITADTLAWAILRENKNASYTAKDLYDPEVNIKYGCLILSLLFEEFQETETVLAAYNAGRGNVLKWLKDSRYSTKGVITHTPYAETDQYIKKVIKYTKQYGEMLGAKP